MDSKLFDKFETWCGCDVGSFCSCRFPDLIVDTSPNPEREGWCKRCNQPVYKAGNKGSYVDDLKVPIKISEV